MNVAVGSVVFMEAIEYLGDFFDSLLCQTEHNFRIMLINDNIPFERLQSIIQAYPLHFQKRIFVIDRFGENLEPYMLRIEMLQNAYEQGIELLVIMDCDDKASGNRIECIVKQFDSEYTFFYNELLDFSGNRVMPPLPNYTTDYRKISEYNYLGMSNNAIYLNNISKRFIESLKDGKTKIFDWYFYSRLLLEGARGKKIKGCCTYYRIYEANTAGKSIYSKEMIKKEIEIKKQHYGLLYKYKGFYRELMEIYEALDVDSLKAEAAGGYWWSLINTGR